MDVAMDYVGRILGGTPWWVWVLFAFLLSRGIRAMRPATGPLWRFAIIPAVFLVWGIATLLDAFGATGTVAAAYLVALAAGAAAGWAWMAPAWLRADRRHGLVAVPGGPTTLVLILVIFVLKYTFGVWQGMDPAVVGQTWFLLADCALSGLVAGLFLGRFARLWQMYRQAPDEDLSAAAG